MWFWWYCSTYFAIRGSPHTLFKRLRQGLKSVRKSLQIGFKLFYILKTLVNILSVTKNLEFSQE